MSVLQCRRIQLCVAVLPELTRLAEKLSRTTWLVSFERGAVVDERLPRGLVFVFDRVAFRRLLDWTSPERRRSVVVHRWQPLVQRLVNRLVNDRLGDRLTNSLPICSAIVALRIALPVDSQGAMRRAQTVLEESSFA